MDGWTVQLPTPERLLASRVTGVLVVGAVLTAGAAVFASVALSSLIALAGMASLATALGGLAFIIRRRARLVQVRIGATHLDIGGGSSRTRLRWEQLSPPRRIADARDGWLQSFDASLQSTEPSAPLPPSTAVPALALRWTQDGRPAAHAHERTDWESLVIGAGLSRDALAWLHAEIERAQRHHAESSRQAAFDEVIAGRPGEKARDALADLVRDRGEGG